MKCFIILFSLIIWSGQIFSQSDEQIIQNIYNTQLSKSPIYENLKYLSKEIGHRISGSEQLEKAVTFTRDLMIKYQFDTVYLQPVMVSNWQRGSKEIVQILDKSGNSYITIPEKAEVTNIVVASGSKVNSVIHVIDKVIIP